jgi:homoserine dehydrogenase
MKKNLTIGMFGFGCVGSGLYSILSNKQNEEIRIKKICVKDKTKPRTISAEKLTYCKDDILNDNEIDVIVELIDDADEAFNIASSAMKQRKPVITANKKMIGENLDTLIQLQQQYNTPFFYEAAVAGSIPIIRTIQQYYRHDEIQSIRAILNGTTNYILTKMLQEKKRYDTVLHEAQVLGFAETNPTLDVDAYDPKYKLQILLANAFGLLTKSDEILNIGITTLDSIDVETALQNNLLIKLVATAIRDSDNINAFVLPTMVDTSDPLYVVNDEFNAIALNAKFIGAQILIGKGAGSLPTAMAVYNDLLMIGNPKDDYQFYDQKLSLNHSSIIRVYLRTQNDQLAKKLLTSIEQTNTTKMGNQYIGYTSISQLRQFNEQLSEVFIAKCDYNILLITNSEKMNANRAVVGIH